jgi:hypothetical protein
MALDGGLDAPLDDTQDYKGIHEKAGTAVGRRVRDKFCSELVMEGQLFHIRRVLTTLLCNRNGLLHGRLLKTEQE